MGNSLDVDYEAKYNEANATIQDLKTQISQLQQQNNVADKLVMSSGYLPDNVEKQIYKNVHIIVNDAVRKLIKSTSVDVVLKFKDDIDALDDVLDDVLEDESVSSPVTEDAEDDVEDDAEDDAESNVDNDVEDEDVVEYNAENVVEENVTEEEDDEEEDEEEEEEGEDDEEEEDEDDEEEDEEDNEVISQQEYNNNNINTCPTCVPASDIMMEEFGSESASDSEYDIDAVLQY